jgi:hypothetical protein
MGGDTERKRQREEIQGKRRREETPGKETQEKGCRERNWGPKIKGERQRWYRRGQIERRNRGNDAKERQKRET